jgi:hypothetical protein
MPRGQAEGETGELDENLGHRRVDTGNVAGSTGHDGVMTLPGAEHYVDVYDIIVAGGRAHQANGASNAERHDRDFDIGRLE